MEFKTGTFRFSVPIQSENFARAGAVKKRAPWIGGKPKKKMRRLVQYLQRRGFSADIIYETTRLTGRQRDTPFGA